MPVPVEGTWWPSIRMTACYKLQVVACRPCRRTVHAVPCVLSHNAPAALNECATWFNSPVENVMNKQNTVRTVLTSHSSCKQAVRSVLQDAAGNVPIATAQTQHHINCPQVPTHLQQAANRYSARETDHRLRPPVCTSNRLKVVRARCTEVGPRRRATAVVRTPCTGLPSEIYKQANGSLAAAQWLCAHEPKNYSFTHSLGKIDGDALRYAVAQAPHLGVEVLLELGSATVAVAVHVAVAVAVAGLHSG